MSEMMSGLFLMIIGMTVVFVFLVILILMVEAIHWVDKTYFPETVADTGHAGASGGTKQEVAAITAAIHQHMRERK